MHRSPPPPHARGHPPGITACWGHWGRGGLTLSCGLEIFIFAYIIHPVQVANFVNAVYLLPMAAGVNKLHLPLVAQPPHPHCHRAGGWAKPHSRPYRRHAGHKNTILFTERWGPFIQGPQGSPSVGWCSSRSPGHGPFLAEPCNRLLQRVAKCFNLEGTLLLGQQQLSAGKRQPVLGLSYEAEDCYQGSLQQQARPHRPGCCSRDGTGKVWGPQAFQEQVWLCALAGHWKGKKVTPSFLSELCWYRGDTCPSMGREEGPTPACWPLPGYHRVLSTLPPGPGPALPGRRGSSSRSYRPYIPKTRKLKKTVTPTRETVAGAVKN